MGALAKIIVGTNIFVNAYVRKDYVLKYQNEKKKENATKGVTVQTRRGAVYRPAYVSIEKLASIEPTHLHL